MKILHVTHGFLEVGGLETFIPILINGMPEHEHTITVWKARRGKFKFNKSVEQINLVTLYELPGIINELKPDLIHIHYTGPESINDGGFLVNDGEYNNVIYREGVQQDHDAHPFGYLYIHDMLYEEGIVKPPIIITCHSAFPLPLTLIRPHIDAIVSVSNKAQEAQKGIRTLQKVIYNGLDTERFKPALNDRQWPPNRKIKILWVGTLCKYDKDVYELLKKYKEINEKCEFIFIGSGGVLDKEPLENYHFIGNVNNPEDYMRECDIFLYPTNLDSFSYAVAEAMACGMYILGSEAVREIIDNAGIVCSFPSEFIKELKWLIQTIDAFKFETVNRFAREIACNKFSSETMVKNYNELYLKLIVIHAAKWANPSLII